MTTLTIFYALLLYIAAAVFLFGTLWRVWLYARTPAPFKIPTTPAPITRAGVAWRLSKETFVFESLFKADKLLWALGWVFHAALLLLLLQHLRFFTQGYSAWMVWLVVYGVYLSGALVVSLIGLWLRRMLIDRVRYVSALSDHLMLALLAAIALTGMAMKYLKPVDVYAVNQFARGLMTLDWQPLPVHGMLMLHLALVALLLMIFPFSKLLHGPALYFSPTRYQVDDARERSSRGAAGPSADRNR
ncbi:MAG: respiratory nitrate reductase subunit gamma [Gammaproteobacteria bacterium]|nr:respiratory nitrate reductase subunit gamma [Gammaproteobacteria bacterium]